MTDATALTSDEMRRLQAWRGTVVALWLATLVAALAVWAVTSAFSTSHAVNAALAGVLVVLVATSAWNTRRGACPRCGQPIRFQPRVELPRTCAGCGAVFWLPTDPPE